MNTEKKLCLTYLFLLKSEITFFVPMQDEFLSAISLFMFVSIFDSPGNFSHLRTSANRTLSCTGSLKGAELKGMAGVQTPLVVTKGVK